jgi:hypothetical protein
MSDAIAEWIGWIIFFGGAFYVARTFGDIYKRLRKLETAAKGGPATTATGLTTDSMKAVEDTTALITGLRRSLLAQGFSAATADELIVQVMRGAANQGGKK